MSASNLPADATFTDHGDGTAEFRWETGTRGTAGSPYVVTVTATNAAGTDSQDVEIEVTQPRGNPNGSQGASFRAR